MTITGIQDLGLEWVAGQRQLIKVVCAPAPGRTLADWAAFVLTIREDPDWPRGGGTLFVPLDPSQGGTPAVQAAGTVTGGVEVTFDVTVPSNPGKRRYALDVWGTGGTAGAVCFLQATWLSVIPSVR